MSPTELGRIKYEKTLINQVNLSKKLHAAQVLNPTTNKTEFELKAAGYSTPDRRGFTLNKMRKLQNQEGSRIAVTKPISETEGTLRRSIKTMAIVQTPVTKQATLNMPRKQSTIIKDKTGRWVATKPLVIIDGKRVTELEYAKSGLLRISLKYRGYQE